MIHFLYGKAGAGKSTAVAEWILSELKEGRRALLLVPEQETVTAEARITALTEAEQIPTDRLEVLSFRRLANRIFREYGLLSYHTVGKGAKALIMWMTLDEVNPLLREYRSSRDGIRRMVPVMLKAVDDFRTYRITPAELDRAAIKAEKSMARFSARLKDLSLVYGAYMKNLRERYDDPKDDLDNLTAKLDDHPEALSGCSVFVDSFHGCTPQEYAVLRRIFRSADQTTVTLGFLPSSRSLADEGLRDTAAILKRMAADTGKRIRETELKGTKRFSNEEIAFLSENLWNFERTDPYPVKPTSVSVCSAPDRYSESEMTAQKISALVRQGVRYREIAVIVRDTGPYEGILDAYLEKYDIPYFLSKRDPLASKPLIRLILSALAIRADSWQTDDVIGYLKTGLTGISTEETDLFETYVNRWSIRGKRFFDEYDWTMNPDGYSNVLSPKAEKTLNEINGIRKKIIAPLNAFFECFDSFSTVHSVSAALYRFLTDLNIPRIFYSEEDVRIWNAVCDTLDQLVAVMPLTRITADLYRRLFLMLISETDIGHIPKGSDTVQVGSSATVRNDGIRFVFLLGVNEGVFPAAIGEDPLFTDSEKLFLENECDLSMPPNTARLESEEMYGFLRSVSCASEGVFLSYPASDPAGNALKPSLAVYRIKALFPLMIEEQTENRPLSARVFSEHSSFETAIRFRGTPEGNALIALYREDPEEAERFDSLKMPISDPKAEVRAETVSRYFDTEIYLSQSRMDAFNGCPFSFWGQYPLHLKEKSRYSFDPADSGTLVHHILEAFLREVRDEYGVLGSISKEKAEEKLSKIVDSYFNAVFGETKPQRTPKSLRFLFDRVERTSKLMLENLIGEFSVSSFQPAFFELRIGTPTSAEPNPIPPPDIRTESGIPVRLTGSVDRVDTYSDGKNVHVRVVDYKTGKKDFKKEELKDGKFIQMPLYLFSICESNDENTRKRFSVPENGSILPAGFLYYHAKLTKETNKKPISEEAPEQTAQKCFSRNGLLTNDTDILEAMEPGLNRRFIPVSKNKDGSIRSNSGIVRDQNEFNEIRSTVHTVIRSTAEAILSGKADAEPRAFVNDEDNPCKYCGLKPVCRKSTKKYEGSEDNEDNE